MPHNTQQSKLYVLGYIPLHRQHPSRTVHCTNTSPFPAVQQNAPWANHKSLNNAARGLIFFGPFLNPSARPGHPRVPISQTRTSQGSHKPDQGIAGFPQARPGHPRIPTSQTRASQCSPKRDQDNQEFPAQPKSRHPPKHRSRHPRVLPTQIRTSWSSPNPDENISEFSKPRSGPPPPLHTHT